MSKKIEFEIALDKFVFLKCEDCPRRFITKMGFENHIYNQHKKEVETTPNEHQQSQAKKDESDITDRQKLAPHQFITHKNIQ